MSNILILGKGFVGNHLYKHLSKNSNLHVSLVSRDDVNYFDEIALKKHIREMHNLFHNVADDFIILNCSGFTGRPNVDECEIKKELCLKYNTELPVFLSNFCKRNKLWFINVSSGCIYSGYEKEFTELDIPNFGIFSDVSSFYSKCKHLNELLVNRDVTTNLRIRMPFCSYNSERNFICKILKYDNLISYDNSLTSLEDFSVFVEKFLNNLYYKNNPGTYNVVNPGRVCSKQIVQLLSSNNLINKNWNFVDLKGIKTKANRSNCILSDSKIADMGLQLPPAIESLESSIKELVNELSN